MKNNFDVEEIYPNILVYSNVFEDNDKMYEIVKSIGKSEEEIFEPWKDWYTFGEKIEEFGIYFNKTKNEMEISKDINPINKTQEDQKYFITELVKAFHLVNNDYIKRFDIDFDLTSVSKTKNPVDQNEADNFKTFPEEVPTWRWTGPSLCKYFDNAGNGSDLSMSYHSDYIREPIITPGYKFAITTTSYINDDYDGGGLDFVIDSKLIGYKPKKGDFVVFPSGHPDILTENGKVYLHGVKNLYNGEKFFTRMYWQKFHLGQDEWFENEEKYGKAEWERMQESIMQDYRESVQMKDISKCVRIR